MAAMTITRPDSGKFSLMVRCFRQIGPPDLDWLFDDLAQRSRKEDKRIALSAIVSVLLHEKRFDSELPRLRELVAGNESLLKADIALAAILCRFRG